MKKLIPILTLCLAVFAVLLSAVGLTVISISASVPQVRLIAIPVAIISLITTVVLTPFAYLFKKDALCKIAFFIDLAALALAVVSIIIWLAVL